jgi:protein Mpv17
MASFQRFLQATTATLPRQCASAGILFATGDCIAQQVVEKKGSKHDIIRTARLTAYGGLIFSPIAAFWLGKVLERVPYKGLAGTVTKVALDQSIAAPSLLALFFTSTTLMEGKSLNDVKVKLQKVSRT